MTAAIQDTHLSLGFDRVERVPTWAFYALLGVVSLAIQGQSVGFPLISDSASLILNNPATRVFDPVAAITTPTTIEPERLSGDWGERTYHYRPVLPLVLSGWHKVAGDSAPLWHGLAVLVNLVTVGLMFRLMRAMEQPRWAAFAIALLFAVNPGRVAGIAPVYGLSDQVFGVFALAAFLCRVGEARWCSLGFLALALVSRETAVLFSVIALFRELLFKTGRRA